MGCKGQIYPFLFSLQLEAWEKWRCGLWNPDRKGGCSLLSETVVYLLRYLNLPFHKNDHPMFTSFEGERWFSIWERSQVRPSYFPGHIRALAQHNWNKYPVPPLSMPSTILFRWCFPYSFALLDFTDPSKHSSRVASFEMPLLLWSWFPSSQGWDSISLLCASFLLPYTSIIEKVAVSSFLRPVQFIRVVLKVIARSATFLF